MMLSPETAKGFITDVVPRISRTLKIFEPTIFPRAMSLEPLGTAETHIASSGAFVPIAITHNPNTFVTKNVFGFVIYF